MITIEELFTASSGYAATVEVLLQGAPANATDSKGNTPLHKAVFGGAATVEVLLRHGADANHTTDGSTPLQPQGVAPPPWRYSSRRRRCQCRHYRWQHPAALAAREGRTFTVKVLLRGRLRHHHQQGKTLGLPKGRGKKLLREAAMEKINQQRQETCVCSATIDDISRKIELMKLKQGEPGMFDAEVAAWKIPRELMSREPCPEGDCCSSIGVCGYYHPPCCCVCYREFSPEVLPREFPCGHTETCSECCEKIEERRGIVQCPMCRR